jgi:hypothetical protein
MLGQEASCRFHFNFDNNKTTAEWRNRGEAIATEWRNKVKVDKQEALFFSMREHKCS